MKNYGLVLRISHSEFDTKRMNPWINLLWWRGWNGVGNVFFAHFGLLIPINATEYFIIAVDHVHHFMATILQCLLKAW